ncbi:MAG: ABC transporter ATP-binding protein/permease [Formivibrio sp.]|nr:ABC transporter ATP-binding protein/permease [Formivibrio sp.]
MKLPFISLPPKVRHLWRHFWLLTKPYWESEEKWRALGLLALVIGLSLGLVFMNVQFNSWYNDFYNTLQKLDSVGFKASIIKFTWLALIYIAIAVYALYFQQMLEVKWRLWLTEYYISRWLHGQGYYRLQLTDQGTDNPDQRIAEDVAQFVSSTLSISLGLLRSVVTLASFIGILWTLSGPITLAGVTIPGYMVWVAIIYALIGTIFTILIGRKLVGLNFQQQRFEADFRFGLVRIRENAESVALYRGENVEGGRLSARLGNVVANFWALMRMQKRLGWFTSFWGQLAIIFPILVAAPRFFAQKITLGGLMQINSAFGQVYGALDFIIGSFGSLANWKAVIDRLSTFREGLDVVENLPVLVPQRIGDSLDLSRISVNKPDGTQLVNEPAIRLNAGERLLIRGPSGCGKSTLLRALAGIWPYAEGAVSYPAQGDVLFLSQKPYLPLGTLRTALYYPHEPANDADALLPLMYLAGLGHLVSRLDDTDQWSHILSLGEQQRVAFIRALLVKPKLLFLDEASSALDGKAEATLYAALVERLPQSILVSVGHRESLIAYHGRTLTWLAPADWQFA